MHFTHKCAHQETIFDIIIGILKIPLFFIHNPGYIWAQTRIKAKAESLHALIARAAVLKEKHALEAQEEQLRKSGDQSCNICINSRASRLSRCFRMFKWLTNTSGWNEFLFTKKWKSSSIWNAVPQVVSSCIKDSAAPNEQSEEKLHQAHGTKQHGVTKSHGLPLDRKWNSSSSVSTTTLNLPAIERNSSVHRGSSSI